ncbi:NADP-dependent oxidoreductase [Actinorugispora endophytica]|uniref:NADPH:quinone reductase-like Zn-dependent oxidoreductase n=1 Tax=Actinorugispora endophytica TaxID=1605990 RepID=A0A4V3D953_9ACTN|nr:NADP-dependent oxidoreductase [Actinorugispora endophytica]TDQ54489.1 NADPH:quinone reductase-like Zn-dependent oxidoreductase [Actinorugispora endophytica]
MAKAVRFTRYGDPDVLTLDEVPTPEPGPRQVRIRVRFAAVNAYDCKVRRGLFAQTPPDAPTGTGLEASGTIDAVGPRVTAWTPGQAVFGPLSPALATHALADTGDLVEKPDWLPFDEAAALPVATETAHRTLRQLDVRPGQTLLIHAASGGVGQAAAQLALARGARVIGTAGTRNHALLRATGVHPVPYGEGLRDRIRALAPDGVDAVLDASGRGVLALSVELAGSPEKVITIADDHAADHGVRFSGGGPGNTPAADVLTEVLPLVRRGALRVPVGRVYPLDRAADAHRLSEQGHPGGKILVAADHD